MSDNFKALILNQEGENFTREVKSIEKSFLKHGDVTVKVDYSDLNYKDALILNNGAKLVKEFPHIPGIDFAGTVIESDNSKFAKGVAVTIDSTHQCMTMRGIKKENATTVTNYYLGQFKEDLSTQSRYLKFISK